MPKKKTTKKKATKKKVGRRSKLNAKTKNKIIEALRRGNYAEVSARYAGISEPTFYRWMERGAIDKAAGNKTKYREFQESVKDAEAFAEVRACGIISRSMPTSWQAAMTFLERKFPKRWSRGERREHSGNVQVATINLDALSDEELDAAIALGAKLQGVDVSKDSDDDETVN